MAAPFVGAPGRGSATVGIASHGSVGGGSRRRVDEEGRKKESKAEANLAKVTNTQRSSSQADGSDSDSSDFSFSVSSPIIGNSWKDEWILDTGTTYHACPNRGWFSSFEKLEGCSVVMGNYHPCSVEGVGTIRIRMFDGMERELKGVRYVPQLKRNRMYLS